VKVVTFGEIMLRLQPEGYLRFVQAEKLTSTFGGAEANVAVSLAHFGIDSYYVTKLPLNDIGDAALLHLRKYGVNTQFIARGGERLGIYYNEKGASQRGSKCIYDRKNSSVSTSVPLDYNWEEIFKGTDCYHITGITPSLSDSLEKICIDSCIAAKKMGVKISVDLNYRSKLWSKEKARLVMSKVCYYADLIITNEEDAKNVFGIEAKSCDAENGLIIKKNYEDVASSLSKMFNDAKVAVTLRTSINANVNKWAALYYDADKFFYSHEYEMFVVDRNGGGDAFAAALIYALLNKYSSQDAVEFATAAGCLKHSIEGDMNLASVEEVKNVCAGHSSGRIKR
jgi:2-dehydro-3-deoxygluconokinase